MNNEVDIWELMAFMIADGVAKAGKIELTYDMVIAAKEQLHIINEEYIVRIYFTTIDVAVMKDINNRMKKLIDVKMEQGLNSGLDTILTKED
jgi:hypothetical protein